MKVIIYFFSVIKRCKFSSEHLENNENYKGGNPRDLVTRDYHRYNTFARNSKYFVINS